LWFRIVSAPKWRHHFTLSARDAVANTVNPAQRADWIATDSTPPSPPMITMRVPVWAPACGTKPKRSNHPSQAVIEVNGMAAASSGERFLGAATPFCDYGFHLFRHCHYYLFKP
jgi:hypothetical protein